MNIQSAYNLKKYFFSNKFLNTKRFAFSDFQRIEKKKLYVKESTTVK